MQKNTLHSVVTLHPHPHPHFNWRRVQKWPRKHATILVVDISGNSMLAATPTCCCQRRDNPFEARIYHWQGSRRWWCGGLSWWRLARSASSLGSTGLCDLFSARSFCVCHSLKFYSCVKLMIRLQEAMAGITTGISRMYAMLFRCGDPALEHGGLNRLAFLTLRIDFSLLRFWKGVDITSQE